MVALSVGVGDVSPANAQDLLQDRGVAEGGLSEISPVLPLPASDYVVNCGKSVLLMIQVPVQHVCANLSHLST